MISWKRYITTICLTLVPLSATAAVGAGVRFTGKTGPGKGIHVVLVAGDDEYHSEEMMPQLAKILAYRQGFDCLVLFSLDPGDGTISPHQKDNIPGLESLAKADLLILFTRFRDLPESQMKHFVDYVESGRPIIGIRTATHAFEMKPGEPYSRYSWNSAVPGWEGGFGRRVLGETWIAHHAKHGKQSTRALIVPGQESNPILRGIKNGEIWVPTDVYEIRLPQPKSCTPLLLGEVLSGMLPADAPVAGKVNEPMLPVAWTNRYTGTQGKTARVFATTMGSSDDFLNPALRRLLVNAALWATGKEVKIPAKANVDFIGAYHPRSFLDTGYTKGIRPADLASGARAH
jgi:Trehalose utilisation